jgi:hypothetical protein
MPTLTRWYIKSSLFYFILAVIIGIGIKAGFSEVSQFSKLTPVYYHLFMVGWVTQLIFGISFWMFPRFTREKPRGNEVLAWITFALLNIGLLLRTISEPLSLTNPTPFLRNVVVVAGIFQWLAGIGYILHIWNRIK